MQTSVVVLTLTNVAEEEQHRLRTASHAERVAVILRLVAAWAELETEVGLQYCLQFPENKQTASPYNSPHWRKTHSVPKNWPV